MHKPRRIPTTPSAWNALAWRSHSSFKPPQNENSSNQNKPKVVRDTPLPKGLVIQGKYAYIWIPRFSQGGKRIGDFARLIQTYVSTLARYEPKGWVIDLRDNRGGNMWPMLAGLGPLLGEGTLGFFTLGGKTQSTWKYEKGSSLLHIGDEVIELASSKGAAVEQIAEDTPIAVLIGPNTSSSGEATLIAFLGLETVQTFGMPTYGVPTANQEYPLSNGSSIIVAGAFFSDRLGTEYQGSIAPDNFVRFDPSHTYGDYRPDDPVLVSATTWLDSQTGKEEEGEK